MKEEERHIKEELRFQIARVFLTTDPESKALIQTIIIDYHQYNSCGFVGEMNSLEKTVINGTPDRIRMCDYIYKLFIL